MRTLPVVGSARYCQSRPSVSVLLSASLGVAESSVENTLHTAIQRVVCGYHALTVAGKIVERDHRFAELYDLLADAPPARDVRTALTDEVRPDAEQDIARSAYLMTPTDATRDAFLRACEKSYAALGETIRALRADKETTK